MGRSMGHSMSDRVKGIPMTEDDIYQQWLITMSRFRREHYLSSQTVGDLTMAETRLLLIIRNVQDRMTAVRPNVLAEISRTTPSALSQLLGSLTRKGVIERKHRSEDFRAVYVVLTPKGEELAGQAEKVVLAGAQGLIAYLGEDDAREAIRIFDKVNDYYENLASEGKARKISGDDDIRDILND